MGKPLRKETEYRNRIEGNYGKNTGVDDEPAILEMIESILNKDGHLVTNERINFMKITFEIDFIIVEL